MEQAGMGGALKVCTCVSENKREEKKRNISITALEQGEYF
jgi:hypothetical protein